MTESEVAWIAGFLEGEGSFCVDTKSNGYSYSRITAASTDKDVLEKLKNLAGGEVYSKKIYADHHKPCWYWSLNTRSDVSRLCGLLHPYLGKRRQVQAETAAWTAENNNHCNRGDH